MKKSFLALCLFLFGVFLFAQETASTPTKKTNIVAVLPTSFSYSPAQGSPAEMSRVVQNYVHTFLTSKQQNILPVTLQETRTTNSLLRKAGVTVENIDDYDIAELEAILGVDHLLFSKVQCFTKTAQTTTSDVNLKEKDKKISGSETTSTIQNTVYTYKVYLDLYKNGDKIYSKDREPFLSGIDTWKDAMEYMLKRMPIFKKL